MIGKHTAWASSRVVLYAVIMVTGLTIAGILGLTKYKISGQNSCIISSKAVSVAREQCCIKFTCASCSSQAQCDDILPGSTCSGSQCMPRGCFEVAGADNLIRCRFVEGTAGIVGGVGIVFLIITIVRAANSDILAFKVSGANVLMGYILIGFSIIMVIATAFTFTGLKKLCKSIKDVTGIECVDASTIPSLDGGSSLFPKHFYTTFSAASIMGWVATLALLVAGGTSIARYYRNESQNSAAISIKADGDGKGQHDIFSETEEDDAHLI